MMEKILIIKGPLQSIGRNILLDNFENNIVDFNCKNYIEFYIKKYRSIFSKIILCTWSNQKPFVKEIDPFTLKGINSIKYLDDDVNDKRKRKLNFQSKSSDYFLLNNTNRAMRLLGYSLENLNVNPEDYIFVVRPDMKIDFSETFESSFLKNIKANKIGIPCFTRSHAVHDFFFVFKYVDALNFFDAQKNRISKTNNPHTDYPINYLYKKTSNKLIKKLYRSISKDYLGRALLLEIVSFNFVPTSKNLLSKVSWRGRNVNFEEIPNYYNFTKNNFLNFSYNSLKILIKFLLLKLKNLFTTNK